MSSLEDEEESDAAVMLMMILKECGVMKWGETLPVNEKKKK